MGKTITLRFGTRDIRGRKAAREALKAGKKVTAIRHRTYTNGNPPMRRDCGYTKTPGRLGALISRAASGSMFDTDEDYVELVVS